MKIMLVALGLFILGFGGIAAFSGGLPKALFDMSEFAARSDDVTVRQPVTLGDYGDVVEDAYQRMLSACSAGDRKTYGKAMNALAVAKRHADTGKIERGNIGDRVAKLTAQFVEAVRKGVITDDHVPFGSLRTIIASVHKKMAAEKPQPELTEFTLRGRIGEAGAGEDDACKAL